MTRASRTPFALVMLIGLLSLAPTPGDIGGCGQAAEDLDPRLFYASLAATDCRACQACALSTLSCANACDGSITLPSAFPAGCAPLAHDGEVCLRRLRGARAQVGRSHYHGDDGADDE